MTKQELKDRIDALESDNRVLSRFIDELQGGLTQGARDVEGEKCGADRECFETSSTEGLHEAYKDEFDDVEEDHTGLVVALRPGEEFSVETSAYLFILTGLSKGFLGVRQGL